MTLRDEIHNVILQLQLCSHVSAANPGSSSKSAEDDIGGRRPPGGIDRKEDRVDSDQQKDKHPERILRSAEHFSRRLERAHSDRTLRLILAEAEGALSAWKRQPPATQEPTWDDPGCGRWIAESKESYKTLANRFGVTPARISQIRKDYAVPTTRIRQHKCVVCRAAKSEEGRTMCSACEEFAELRDSVGDPFDEEVAVA